MWNLIPQLFYDFLARIVPGAVLIVALNFVIFGISNVAEFVLNPPENSKLFTVIPILLGVLGSYLIGFIFGQLWEMTIARFTKRKRYWVEEKCKKECLIEHNRFQKALGRPELKFKSDDLPRAFVMHGHLRHVIPSESLRLLKIRAERRLCQVLILGIFVLSIINAAYLMNQSTIERIILEILFIIVIVVCWRRNLRQLKQFITGITISWLFQTSSGQIPAPMRIVKSD